MGNFNLPKKVARLIVLQRIELLSPFLAKIRKLFGRYFFSNFITRFFLDPKIIREKYYKIMADEFSIIERFIDSNDKIFLSIGGGVGGLELIINQKFCFPNLLSETKKYPLIKIKTASTPLSRHLVLMDSLNLLNLPRTIFWRTFRAY